MKKIFLLLLSLVFVVGCAALAPAPSDSLVKDGLKNLIGVSSYNFEITLSGDFDAAKEAKLVKFLVDGQVAGKVDSKDPKDPKFSMSLSGNGSLDSSTVQTISADLRVNKENIFFNIASLPSFSDDPAQAEAFSQFVGKWWKIPIPEGTYTEDNPLIGLSSADPKTTAEYEKLFDENNLFTDLSYKGEEVVKGENSFKYSCRLDKDGLKNFLIAQNKVAGGAEMTAEEISQLDKLLNSMTFTGDIYVGSESKKVNKVSGHLYVKDASEEQVKEGNFDLSLTVWDFGKLVSLELPEQAELFNPFMLLGAPEASVPAEVPATTVPVTTAPVGTAE